MTKQFGEQCFFFIGTVNNVVRSLFSYLHFYENQSRWWNTNISDKKTSLLSLLKHYCNTNISDKKKSNIFIVFNAWDGNSWKMYRFRFSEEFPFHAM